MVSTQTSNVHLQMRVATATGKPWSGAAIGVPMNSLEPTRSGRDITIFTQRWKDRKWITRKGKKKFKCDRRENIERLKWKGLCVEPPRICQWSVEATEVQTATRAVGRFYFHHHVLSDPGACSVSYLMGDGREGGEGEYRTGEMWSIRGGLSPPHASIFLVAW